MNPKIVHDASYDPSKEQLGENNFDIAKILLINENNCLLRYWMMLDITCCLFSSYFYAWVSYFGADNSTSSQNYTNSLLYTAFFEGIFSISIVFKLMTTYVPEGEIIPVTNHSLIF